jgi:hypothetical protein
VRNAVHTTTLKNVAHPGYNTQAHLVGRAGVIAGPAQPIWSLSVALLACHVAGREGLQFEACKITNSSGICEIFERCTEHYDS